MRDKAIAAGRRREPGSDRAAHSSQRPSDMSVKHGDEVVTSVAKPASIVMSQRSHDSLTRRTQPLTRQAGRERKASSRRSGFSPSQPPR